MLRIENLKLSPGGGPSALRNAVLHILRIPEKDLLALHILRRSIDAREGVRMVYTVEVEAADEAAVLRRCRDKHVFQGGPPACLSAPGACDPAGSTAGGGGCRDLRACLPHWYWHEQAHGPFCWSGAAAWSERTAGRGALLVHRRAGPHQQRPVRRGRRRGLFRRQAQHRHPGPPPPLYSGAAGLAAARRRTSSSTPSPMWARTTSTSP